MPSRRHFIAGSAVAVGAAALLARQGRDAEPTAEAEGTAKPTGERPSFVVILADDLGYGELGSYGQRLIQTPHLDRLAKEGLRFTDAYSTAPVCAPSRCSLLTGLHAGHSRVRDNPNGDPDSTALRDGDTTFAEVLRARGYRTACIGKWGFGPESGGQPSHPNSRGFEEFYGYITHGHAHQYYPPYIWHNADKVPLPENAGGRKVVYAPDLFRDRAVAFIREHEDEPFLLFLSLNLPHAPNAVPEMNKYANRPWADPNRRHAAQVTRLDEYVGAILAALRGHGLDDSTIVLVTSDNGPHEEGRVNPDLFQASGPLRGYKRNLYEGGIRIPLIAWSPRRIRPGTNGRPTQQTDLLPTLAELAGAPAPSDIDGRSIAPLLDGRDHAGNAHPYLYFSRRDTFVTARADWTEGHRLTRLAEAVRQDRWKAVRYAPARDRTAPDDEWEAELYDLRSDPRETTDLAATHPAVVARLVRLMRDAWVDTYDREPFGLSVQAPHDLSVRIPEDLSAPTAEGFDTAGDPRPGTAHTIAATLSNGSSRPWASPRFRLDAPAGWQVRPVSRDVPARLAPGGQARCEWRVTVPRTVDATRGEFAARLTVTAEVVLDGSPLRFQATT